MTIPPDMAITESMLAPPGSEPGLRAIVPPGKRAVSVTVDEAACVAGFVRRGCRVDVSAVDKHGVSRLILSDVEVAAIGQSMSEPSADGKTTQIAKTVTLFVDPEQVQMVHAYTSDRSKIKLALRGDHKDKRGASLWSDLLARAAAPRPAPPRANPEPAAPREHVMNIVRGTEVQRIVYTEAGGNVSRPGPAKNPRPAPAPSGGSACPSSPAKTPSVAESNE
jgi:pilus assembly protein CpaB